MDNQWNFSVCTDWDHTMRIRGKRIGLIYREKNLLQLVESRLQLIPHVCAAGGAW